MFFPGNVDVIPELEREHVSLQYHQSSSNLHTIHHAYHVVLDKYHRADCRVSALFSRFKAAFQVKMTDVPGNLSSALGGLFGVWKDLDRQNKTTTLSGNYWTEGFL